MINQPYVTQQQPIFQKDPTWAEALQEHKEKAHVCCKQYVNRRVRIQTINGQVYEGVIVNVDDNHVYLMLDAGMYRPIFPGPGLYPGYYPGAYPGYYPTPYPSPASAILPLVLYELLVISLL